MVFPDLCDFGRLREWHAEKESSFLSLSPAWSASTFKFEKTENQIEDGRLWKPVFSPVRKRWGPLLLCGWSGWSVGEISYLLSTATHWPTATLVWVDSIDSIYNCPHFFQTYDGPVQLRKAGGIPNSHAWTREAVNIAVVHVNSNSNRASVFVWVAFLARWESIWAGVKWIILSDIRLILSVICIGVTLEALYCTRFSIDQLYYMMVSYVRHEIWMPLFTCKWGPDTTMGI